MARSRGTISNFLNTTIGTPWHKCQFKIEVYGRKGELAYLTDELAAKPSEPKNVEERHNESDDSLGFEHAAKALGLLEQIGHDILMGELHTLHEP